MHIQGWIGTFVLAGVFALASSTSNAQTIGNASSGKPEASGTVAGTLFSGRAVPAKETVNTRSAARANLRFHDSSNLSVGPSSSVRLDKFVYDPNKGASSV